MDDLTHKQIKGKVLAAEQARVRFDRVWAECENFYAGEQNIYRRLDGTQVYATTLGNAPGWRNRYTYNNLTVRVDREVAAYTGQFPAYDVRPSPPVGANSSTVKGQSATAAALAGERILTHLFDDLSMAEKDAQLKSGAAVLGEMFAWPMIDTTQGEVLPGTGIDDKPEKRTGKIALKVLDPTQLVWEQGKSFDESRWHAVKCFYTKQEAYDLWPDKWDSVNDVQCDAMAQPTLSGAIMDKGYGTPNLMTAWHYFERPTAANAKGKYTIFSSNNLLEENDYPYLFPETNDEPWIVRFYYRLLPRRSRGQGMVEGLLDPQRAINRRRQLQSEWTNFSAVPGMNVPRDAASSTDFEIEPGFRFIYTPGVSTGVDFVRPGEMPSTLANSPNDLKSEMDGISGQFDFSGVATSAPASTVQQIVAQNQSRQGTIARGFQASHAKLGRRFLLLARSTYTETRKFTYKSQAGANEAEINASRDLPSFIDVEVQVNAPMSPAQVQGIATQWGTMPWGIPPEKVMLAIENSDLDEITGSFKRDIERQQRRNADIMALDPDEIAPLIAGFANILAQEMAATQQAGAQLDPSQVSPPPGPWPHADPSDNEAICISVLTDWMKTQEFEMMDRANQQVAKWLLQELQMQDAAKKQAQMAAQAATAMAQGATNASRPGQPATSPSQASLDSQTPDDVNSQQQQPVAPTAA